jgi:hypothetical protein
MNGNESQRMDRKPTDPVGTNLDTFRRALTG